VELVCGRYGIPFVKTFGELVFKVRDMFEKKEMVLKDTSVEVDEQKLDQLVGPHLGMPPAGTVSPPGT
jgi:hypothetical protein